MSTLYLSNIKIIPPNSLINQSDHLPKKKRIQFVIKKIKRLQCDKPGLRDSLEDTQFVFCFFLSLPPPRILYWPHFLFSCIWVRREDTIDSPLSLSTTASSPYFLPRFLLLSSLPEFWTRTLQIFPATTSAENAHFHFLPTRF